MRTAFLVCVIAASVVFLIHVLRSINPGQTSTVEQLLNADDLQKIQQLRASFNTGDDFVVVHITRVDSPNLKPDLDDIVANLYEIPTIVAVVPIETIVFIQLKLSAYNLEQSRRLNSRILATFANLEAAGFNPILLGSTDLRVASWEASRRDLERVILPLIILVALIPMAVFGHWSAALLPLVLATLTASITMAGIHWSNGTLGTITVFILPFVFSVATLDALHLVNAARRRNRLPGQNQSEIRKLFLPCLYTTLTTVAGLLVLMWQGNSPLLRDFGLWCAFATVIAFVFTFMLGPAFLDATSPKLIRGRTPVSRSAARLVLQSIRHRKSVIALWSLAALFACLTATQLRVSSYYPNIFAQGHPYQQRLQSLIDATGVDSGPIEIYLRADTKNRPQQLLEASALLIHYVSRFDETRWVLPQLLIEKNPGSDADKTIDKATVERWFLPREGLARIQLFLRKTDQTRKREIIRWLRHFDRTFLDDHSLSFGGAGFIYTDIESRAVEATLVSAVLMLFIVLLMFTTILRSAPRALAASLGTALPLVAISALLFAANINWSIALLPLPAILIGLAVDDAIHLLWGLRKKPSAVSLSLAAAAFRAGPALIATSLLLAACVATMISSEIQGNRDLGYLLATSIMLALLCNFTLVPALITIFQRKSVPATR